MISVTNLQNTLNELQSMINNSINPVFSDLQNASHIFDNVITSHGQVISKIDEMITFLSSDIIQGLKGEKGDKGDSGDIYSLPPSTPYTLQDVTSSRIRGVNYTNTTDKPIFVSVSTIDSGVVWLFYVNGLVVNKIYESSYEDNTIVAFVSAGSTYQITGQGGISVWTELR